MSRIERAREITRLADYLIDTRLNRGEWPKALLVHPSADLDLVRQAVLRAKARYPEK